MAFTGEYRYEPGVLRPHKLRLRVPEMDAADLEAELMPTLRPGGNLIARALGRAPLPDWLTERQVEGTLQVDDLRLAGWRLENIRARLLWDAARVQLEGIQARLYQDKLDQGKLDLGKLDLDKLDQDKLDQAAITGNLEITLRGLRPSYKLTAKVRGVTWQSGKLEAEGTVETFGTGTQLLTNLTSEGVFMGTAVDLGTFAPLRSVSGAYSLAWWQGAPRLRLTSLSLRTEDETYTGRGATQQDGRLVILLTNGSKEMRMSGSLARLRVDEAVKQ